MGSGGDGSDEDWKERHFGAGNTHSVAEELVEGYTGDASERPGFRSREELHQQCRQSTRGATWPVLVARPNAALSGA